MMGAARTEGSALPSPTECVHAITNHSLAETWEFLRSGVDDMVCSTDAHVADEAIHGGHVV